MKTHHYVLFLGNVKSPWQATWSRREHSNISILKMVMDSKLLETGNAVCFWFQWDTWRCTCSSSASRGQPAEVKCQLLQPAPSRATPSRNKKASSVPEKWSSLGLSVMGSNDCIWFFLSSTKRGKNAENVKDATSGQFWVKSLGSSDR